MKLLRRATVVFLTALVLLTAAYAEYHSDTDIAYAVTGGNIYFDKSSGTVTGCDKDVTEAVIPAQIDGVAVTSIENYAFSACSGLTSVEIPNSVTSIGNGAFYFCSGLTSVEIPNSVTSIGNSAFYRCSGLTNIHVASGNQQYVSIDGVLFDKSQTTLICYPDGKTGAYQIPASVTFIGGAAFAYCSGLTSVEIPNGVTSIGYNAFDYCSGLTSVEIPNSVTSIGNRTFFACSGLTSVEIPNSVTSIGDAAFANCSGLTSVEIPNGVTSIGNSAFYRCSGLTSVEIPDSVTYIGELAFSGCGSLRDVYYSGSRAQWEAINGINDSGLISDEITIHYGVSAPEFTVPSAPTVGGNAIRQADLSGLTEISIPLTISAESAASVTICVPFFDDGKFLGMGFVTATVDKNTASVTVPVTGNVSGAEKLKVIFVDADFRPLSAAAGFDIAA